MWSPTHVQVTVQRAKGLLSKGKNGTNDAFVTIGLGKEKYQTSIKEKVTDLVEWHEKCELQIPKQGNTAEIVLTVLHHNFIGVDEFLGCISIPLAELDVYERPRNRWYKLRGKPSKEKKEVKERGDLEVKVAFIVKSGSLADLSKKEKHKSSLGQLSTALGGSLISISSLDKRKGLKKLAGKIGSKISNKQKHKVKRYPDCGSLGDIKKLSQGFGDTVKASEQRVGDADPGVISEGESEDEFTLDDLSHKGSGYSLEIEVNSTPKSGSLENLAGGEFLRRSDNVPPTKPPRAINTLSAEPEMDEWAQKLYGKYGKDSMSLEQGGTLQRRLNSFNPLTSSTPGIASSPTSSPVSSRPVIPTDSAPTDSEDKPLKDYKKSPTLSLPSKNSSSKSSIEKMERIIIGGENDSIVISSSRLPGEVMKQFEGKTREDLIEMVMDLQNKVIRQQQQQRDLEDYLDQLLLRVMETSPRILQNPYMNCKTQAKIMYLACKPLHLFSTDDATLVGKYFRNNRYIRI